MTGLNDPSAPEDPVTVVTNQGLAGSDGELRLIEYKQYTARSQQLQPA